MYLLFLKDVHCMLQIKVTSQEHYGISNHRQHDCLFNCLFRLALKKCQSPHYWPFVRGIHQWLVDSPHKGPVTWKAFPCRDVIMQWIHPNHHIPHQSLFMHGQYHVNTVWYARTISVSARCMLPKIIWYQPDVDHIGLILARFWHIAVCSGRYATITVEYVDTLLLVLDQASAQCMIHNVFRLESILNGMNAIIDSYSVVVAVCRFSIGPIGFTDQTGEGLLFHVMGRWNIPCRTDETKSSCDRLWMVLKDCRT